jgi:hypothetical protein
MSRWLLAAIGVFAVLNNAVGQQDGSFLIKLSVQPQVAPSPSLRYRLLPSLSEQKADDAAPLYKKAAEMIEGLRDREEQAKLDRFLSIQKFPKPKDLPRKDVRLFLERYEEVLKVVDQAARCEHCDWDLAQRLREQGAAAPIPEIQSMRKIANLLSLRTRLALAEGRLDDALRDIQTGLALARHVGQSPTLISAIVGMALGNIICVRLQEFVECDKAPNLYWALTDLPRPFVDLRLPLQGERLMVYASFPGGADAAADLKAPLSDKVTIADLEKFFDFAEERRDDLIERALPHEVVKGIRRLDLGLGIMARHEAARKALIDAGRPRDVVEAMPPLQVAIMHGLLEYDRLLDDVTRWQSLPFWEAYPRVREYMDKARLDAEMSSPDAAAIPLGRSALPWMERVLGAQVRMERRFAVLRCAEAIRLYAAAHDGKLPAALADIKEVPVPVDPVTGHGFEYTVEGNAATLYGPPFDKKQKPGQINSIRVELQLRS